MYRAKVSNIKLKKIIIKILYFSSCYAFNYSFTCCNVSSMRFTLNKYLILPFAAVLSLLSAAYLIFNGYSTLTYTFEASRDIIQQQHKIHLVISDMYRSSQERIQTLLIMSTTVDDFELDELRQQMRQQADVFLTARNKLLNSGLSEAELQHYYPTAFRQTITKNAGIQNIAADLFVEKKHVQAVKVLLTYSTPKQMDLLSSIAKMHTILDEEIEATMVELDTKFARARFDFKLSGSFVFIIFTLIIMTIIIRLLHGKHLLSGLLENREIQYKRIVDSVQDGIITMSEDGNISSFNRGAEKIFSCKASDAIGDNIRELINDSSHDAFNRYIKAVLNGSEFSGLELTGKRYNDEDITLYIAFSNTGLSDGQKISGTLRDITIQKKTEEEQIKKSKLESIGVLAGGIAHDFNNLLSGINGYIELAQQNLSDKEKTLRFLKASKQATERATGLTQQLLTFAKGGEPIKQNADISGVIRQAADFNLHGSNITCHYDIADDLWLANIDSEQISQVIHNLIINAKLAMQDSGEIHISCLNATDIIIKDVPHKNVIKTSGKYIKITIEDTGSGIPENILDSIFDPYFTTREGGSGLGLALSYSIITKHHGFIYVQSTVGYGTCFTIYLPASENQKIVEQSDPLDVSPADSTKRIMLMDDDAVVREVAESMLSEMGYKVVSAATGEEAISIYKSALHDKEPIDLIIMDLTIAGGMGGEETIKILRSLDPEVKAIVSSGYSNDTVMANFSDYGFQASMAKPYSYDTLRETMQQHV